MNNVRTISHVLLVLLSCKVYDVKAKSVSVVTNGIKNIQIHSHTSDGDKGVDLPTQIIIDFKTKPRFEEQIDENGMLSLSFSNMKCGVQEQKDLIKKLMTVNVVEDVAIEQNGGNVTVAIKLRRLRGMSGALVRLSTTNNHHRSHRLVLDVYPKKFLHRLAANTRGLHYARGPSPGKGMPRVIIDAGHGGQDAGAQGLFSLVEKDVVLDIAQRIKPELEKVGVRAILTRSSDSSLSPVQRSTIAQQLQADLFVSIHANSAGERRRPSGVETFFCDPSLHDESKLLFSSNDVEQKALTIVDASIRSFLRFSQQLSRAIQENVLRHLAKGKCASRDRGVKKEAFALFLQGHVPARDEQMRLMPVSLVEVGFITNPEEARHLKASAYRQLIARGISMGIRSFIENRG